MSHYTPGPWAVSEASPLRVVEAEPRFNTIATMGTSLGFCSDQQARANAALVAKAPKMHALLRDVLPHIDKDSPEGYYVSLQIAVLLRQIDEGK